jgi:hypothetical protein
MAAKRRYRQGADKPQERREGVCGAFCRYGIGKWSGMGGQNDSEGISGGKELERRSDMDAARGVVMGTIGGIAFWLIVAVAAAAWRCFG